jgi:hypothetical protein
MYKTCVARSCTATQNTIIAAMLLAIQTGQRLEHASLTTVRSIQEDTTAYKSRCLAVGT